MQALLGQAYCLARVARAGGDHPYHVPQSGIGPSMNTVNGGYDEVAELYITCELGRVCVQHRYRN